MTKHATNSGGSISPGAPAPILTYHTVEPKKSKYIYSATCEQFEKHLSLISSRPAAPNARITFDDGRDTDYAFAVPLLEKYGLKATFFVTAGLIENRPGFMTWEQIKELAALGHDVQSHGWSHALLNRVDERSLYEELSRSREELQARIGKPIDAISLPGGRWTPHVLEACSMVGYTKVYHSNPWRALPSPSGLEFHGRFMVRNTTGEKALRGLLDGDRFLIFYYRTQHEAKEFGRRVLGDRFYHRAWQVVASLAGRQRSRSLS